MAKQRKVNAPASRRRERTKPVPREPKGRHRLESAPADTGRRFFLVLAAGVAGGIALLVALAVYLPSMVPRGAHPWENYAERMVVDPARSAETGRETRVYAYGEKEVKGWLAGVRDRRVDRVGFGVITGRAVELLAAGDAARVLEVAAKAHPEWRGDLEPGVAATLGKLSTALPEERALRMRLEAAMEDDATR